MLTMMTMMTMIKEFVRCGVLCQLLMAANANSDESAGGALVLVSFDDG